MIDNISLNNEQKTNEERVSAYDLIKAGDKHKQQGVYGNAIKEYLKAYVSGTPTQIKYLVPRVAACYRRLSQPVMALNFYRGAKEMYGENVDDSVMLTVLAGIYGDLKNWEKALYCADCACALNDGEINEYLENVYRRIDENTSKMEFA